MVDPSYLACAHHSLMVGAVGLFPTDKVRILLVGLGGGGLAMYLTQHIRRAHVDVVEIDPTMAKVAREDFGFQDSDRLNLIIADGLEYIRTFNGDGYHLVMFDVDSKDSSVGMSCPPRQFVELEMLQTIKEKCLQPNGTTN